MRQEMTCTQSCTDTQREMSTLEITWDAGISPYSLLFHLYFNNIKLCGLVVEIIRFLRYTIRPGQTIRFQSTTLWTMLCDAILLTIFENVGKTPIQDVKKLLLTCIVFLNHWNGIFALCLQYSLIFSNCNGKRMWAEMVLMCVVFQTSLPTLCIQWMILLLTVLGVDTHVLVFFSPTVRITSPHAGTSYSPALSLWRSTCTWPAAGTSPPSHPTQSLLVCTDKHEY